MSSNLKSTQLSTERLRSLSEQTVAVVGMGKSGQVAQRGHGKAAQKPEEKGIGGREKGKGSKQRVRGSDEKAMSMVVRLRNVFHAEK